MAGYHLATPTRAFLRAAATHNKRIVAARLLLNQWAKSSAFVAFAREDGRHVPRLEPHAMRPGGAAWHVDSDEAEEILVATVVAGARYLGWEEVMRQAEAIKGGHR